MDPSSVPSLLHTHQNLLHLSSKLSIAIIVLQPGLNGSNYWPNDLLLEVLALLMVQATAAQQIRQFPCLKTFSRMSEKDGSHVSSTTTFTRVSCMHASPIKPQHSSRMMNSFRSYKTCNPASHPTQWTPLSKTFNLSA